MNTIGWKSGGLSQYARFWEPCLKGDWRRCVDGSPRPIFPIITSEHENRCNKPGIRVSLMCESGIMSALLFDRERSIR